MLLVFGILLLLYCFVIGMALLGWLFAPPSPEAAEAVASSTLVIPFRNEKENLPHLIKSLEKQTNKPEVLFVNDHSSDGGEYILEKSGFRVVLNTGEGKKQATATGIEMATTPFVLFTDADCVLPENYTAILTQELNMGRDLVYAPVLYSPSYRSLWHPLFFLDQLSLTGVSVGLGQANMFTYCSAAAMGVQKGTSNDLSGALRKSTNLSGDDLLMMDTVKRNDGKIKAITNKNATVLTVVPSTLGEFLRQRLRWGQKASGYTNPSLVALTLLVFFTHWAIIYCLCSSFSSDYIELALLPVLAKLLIDFLFLFLVGYKLGYIKPLLFFIPAWIFNLFYVPLVGIVGVFYAGRWKDRKIR